MEQAQSDNGAGLAAQSVLAQMAARHQVAAAEDAASFDAALRSAFARMAKEWSGLGAQVQSVSHRPISVAEVADLVEPGMFVALLDGAGDNLGVALVCPTLMAGLVEGVATGRVLGLAGVGRQPTRTDAALLAPILDVLLRQMSERCAGLPARYRVQDFVYGSFLQDPRPLSLLLEDGRFRLLSFAVTLGPNIVRGHWSLILPVVPDTPVQAAPLAAAEARIWAQQLQSVVCASPAQLDAVLFRAQLSLSTALLLAPGDMLCIPVNALESLSLCTLDGKNIGMGRLGQARGQRAVRLTQELGPVATQDGPAIPRAASMTPVIRAVDGSTVAVDGK